MVIAPERNYSVWIEGAILSSLSTVHLSSTIRAAPSSTRVRFSSSGQTVLRGDTPKSLKFTWLRRGDMCCFLSQLLRLDRT